MDEDRKTECVNELLHNCLDRSLVDFLLDKYFICNIDTMSKYITLNEIDYDILGVADMYLRDLGSCFDYIIRPQKPEHILIVGIDFQEGCLENIVRKHIGNVTLYSYLVNRELVSLVSLCEDIKNHLQHLSREQAQDILDKIRKLELDLLDLFWTEV